MNNLSFNPTITDTKGILLEIEGEIISIEAFGRNAVRVRASKSLHLESPLWTLLPQEKTEPRIVVLKNRATISTESITASIDDLGSIEFLSPDGHLILRESWIDTRVDHAPIRRAREYRTIASNSFKTWQYFETSDDERFFGLGQQANGHLDQKGMKIDLMQKNGRVSIPFLLSNKGYGVIWNTPSIGSVILGRDVVEWHSECQSQIDYIVVGGGTPEEVNRNFTAITGRAKALPEWSTGLWQSRLRYTTQNELESVLSGYVNRGINLSAIVIDYFHWPVQGSWKFDEKYWPDVEAMTRLAQKYGIKIFVSVWPTVDPRSEHHKVMKSSNMLIRAEEGVDVFFMVMGPEGIIDATNPKTREFVWEKLKQNYLDRGISQFWLDEAEPEMRPYSYDNIRLYLGNGLEVANIYPFYYAQMVNKGMKDATGEESVSLIRSAWLGSQREGIVLWSGDIPSTFESLSSQIKAALNVSLSGIPWWTSDIGGFRGGDPSNHVFRELIIRWFQFGVFCPVLRMHGKRKPYDSVDKLREYDAFLPSSGPNEIWSYGNEAEGIFRSMIALREKLRPYISREMKKNEEDGRPMMCPLFFYNPEDEKSWGIEDEYYFGEYLVVAPITKLGERERTVYLPKGEWISGIDGKCICGPAEFTASVSLSQIAFYIKKGVDAEKEIIG